MTLSQIIGGFLALIIVVITGMYASSLKRFLIGIASALLVGVAIYFLIYFFIGVRLPTWFVGVCMIIFLFFEIRRENKDENRIQDYKR